MRYLSILLASFFSAAASAKAAEDTWLKTQSPENASYFAPVLRYSNFNGEPALWPGAKVGWIVGSVISVGFEGYMIANEIRADFPDTAKFSMAVAGLTLQAIPSPEERTHFIFSLLIGGGGAQAGGDADFDTLSNHKFMAVEPGAGLEFNLTRNIRLSPEVSYLWLSNAVPGMNSKWEVSETAFSLTLKFKEPDDL